MGIRKRIACVVAGTVVAIVLALLSYVASGSSVVESWVGSQLLEIGGNYLEPKLRFERLTYVRPTTILLDNLTLSSPDPTKTGSSMAILSVKRARLELTEIPRRGQPIRFSKIILESPEIHAIAAIPGGAALVGFSKLVKGSANPQVQGESTGQAPMKLSDFLLIRHIEIQNGIVSYDPRMADTPPIFLDGINMRLDFTPASTSSNPGLYTIATTISRKPMVELDLQGQMNIDTLTLDLAKLELTLDLQEKNGHFLPPELQKLMKRFEVTGQLRGSAAGNLPLTDLRQCTLQSTGELSAARMAAGQNRLSIDSWNWEGEVTGGIATVRRADAHLLGGELHLTGTIPFDDAQPASLELNASNLRIEQLLRTSKADERPLYAGNVAANVTFSAPLAMWNTEAGGSGTLSIQQGRIDKIPVWDRIVTSLSNLVSKSLGGDGNALTDSAEGSFKFVGDGIQLDHFSGTSGTMAFRGTGTVGFDRHLDLRLNAGPMERLQDSLGVVGKAWAIASDRMAGYRVNGTLGDPQVSMELGGGP